MKKIVSLMLAVAMLLMCSVCFADAAELPVLVVGTNPEFDPFEYVGDSGEVEGIDIDIMNEIAKDLGVTIQIQPMDFDALVPSVLSGKIDASIAGMTITADRLKSVAFSDPYFYATQVVILPEGSAITTVEDLKGKKVGVQLGTTGDLMMSEEQYEIGEVARYNKGMDAAMDLMNGRLDAVVIDTLPAQQFAAALEGLVVVDTILVDVEVEAYGIAIAKENTELVAKINASLARIMEDGTYEAILVKYVESEEEAAEEVTEETATEETAA